MKFSNTTDGIRLASIPYRVGSTDYFPVIMSTFWRNLYPPVPRVNNNYRNTVDSTERIGKDANIIRSENDDRTIMDLSINTIGFWN